MQIAKEIFLFITSNSALILTIILIAIAVFKPAKLVTIQAILADAKTALDTLDRIPASATTDELSAAALAAAKTVAQETKLTLTQASSAVKVVDGKPVIDKSAVAAAVMQSGDFKKALTKASKWLKKI